MGQDMLNPAMREILPWQAMMDCMDDAFAVINADGVVVQANKVAADFNICCGHKTNGNLCNILLGICQDSCQACSIFHALENHLAAEKEVYNATLDQRFLISLFPLRQEEAKYTLLKLEDITQQHLREKAKEQRLFHFQSMQHINLVLAESRGTKKTLLNLLCAMRSIFKADRVCLLTPDKHTDDSWLVPMQSTADEFSHITISPMLVSSATNAIFQSTLSASQPLLIAAADSPEFKKKYAIQNQLVFSIHSKIGKPWLVALHRCANDEIWSDNQCRVLAAIADRVTDVLDAWQLNETLEWRTDQYKQLVDNMPDGVIILQHNCIVFANEVMQDMLGEEDEQRYLGKNIEAYIHPAFVSVGRSRIAAALSGKRNPIHEIKIKAQDGHILDVVSSSMLISFQGEPAVQIIMRDVTRRNQLDKVLHQSLADNQQLARQMINIQEQERVAIAQDLHDDSGQMLTAMSINLQSIKNNIHEEKLLRRLEETESMVNRLFKSIRSSLETLNPTHIDVLGLEDAILSELDVWSARYGVEVSHHLAIGHDAPSPEIATTIFRVTQEALTNIAKYAKATAVDVSLLLSEQDSGVLLLTIADNGVGFTSKMENKHNSYGILGMQTRTQLISGTFHLTSELNIGTTIHAEFPLQVSCPIGQKTTKEVNHGQ